MPTMAWSTPGWPANGALTPVTSPDAARLALRAEAETSVLDPVGMRRLWVRELAVVVASGIAVLMVVASVQFFRNDETPRWWVPLVVSEPAVWPPGSEAFAVLSGAASVDSAPEWLCERIGMSPAVGLQWIAVLAQQGWLVGGGRPLGLRRLPEKHVMVTNAGRERLAQERARLELLAAR